MKGLVHDDDRRTLHALAVAVKARELDRSLVRLAAGVAEEDSLHASHRCKLVGELFLLRDAIEIRSVDQTPALLCYCLHQPGMAVAERVYRDARQRVEISLARFVPQPHPFAAGEGNGNATVRIHQMRHDSPINS